MNSNPVKAFIRKSKEIKNTLDNAEQFFCQCDEIYILFIS